MWFMFLAQLRKMRDLKMRALGKTSQIAKIPKENQRKGAKKTKNRMKIYELNPVA